MSFDAVTQARVAPQIFDPQAFTGQIQDAKSAVIKTLQQSVQLLTTKGAEKQTSITKSDGLPDLAAPTFSKQVNDLTLRIGLLQDALNQLMAKVSKQEINQRMNEMQKENQRQLEKFKDQMEKAAEAAKKNKEAEKKGNVFEAVSNWIQAVVSVVSAIVTMISAVGQILTNPVGAAGLIVASVALIGAAAVQITLAIDATMRAAGKEGFLSEADRTKMAKAVEILGYIALAGSMIGLVGGVVVALGQAGKAAGTLAGKEIGRVAAAKLAATGTKELAQKSMNMTIARVAAYAFKDAMQPLLRLGGQMATIQLVGQGVNMTATGVAQEKITDLQKQASDLQAEADLAEAAAKAIQAMVAKLRALIEQLQQELEAMVEQGQQTLAIIFGAIDESAESMTRVQHNLSA